MRNVWQLVTVVLMGLLSVVNVSAQDKVALSPTPRTVTMAELRDVEKLDGQLVRLTALVRHTDTAQVFTFGEKGGAEFHTIIPNPATDAAHVGDTVAITGFVRRFSAGDFERDYRWFRRADYPDVKSGDWVIVATSVRTPEGTEMVPPMTISNTPPNAPETKAR
jgi:hypothetical protein